jgi:hypothetical protein
VTIYTCERVKCTSDSNEAKLAYAQLSTYLWGYLWCHAMHTALTDLFALGIIGHITDTHIPCSFRQNPPPILIKISQR